MCAMAPCRRRCLDNKTCPARPSSPHASGYGANLPPIQAAATNAGHITLVVDHDGQVRRVPLLIEFVGDYYEALSLAMVRTLYGLPRITPVFARHGAYDLLEGLALPGYTIPVGANASALVPFRGRKFSFSYASAADAISGRADKEELAGAIVVVGTSAKDLVDMRPTPVNNEYPGVEIHATMVAAILDQKLRHSPAYARGMEFLQLLVLGVLLSFTLPLASPAIASTLAMLALAATVGVNLAFWQNGLVMPLASSLLLIILIFVLSMSYVFFFEKRRKQQLSTLFGQYAPRELVN